MFKSSYADVLGLPSSKRSIIKSRYTASEIHTRLCIGETKIAEYSTYLYNGYSRNGVKVEELVALDNQSIKPWLASKLFHGIEPNIKPRIYAAMEKMRENTDGKVFGSSPDAEPLILSAMTRGNESLSSADLKNFKELEAIVVAEEQMLKLKVNK